MRTFLKLMFGIMYVISLPVFLFAEEPRLIRLSGFTCIVLLLVRELLFLQGLKESESPDKEVKK